MKKTWGIGLCAILLTVLAVIITANLQKKIILNEAKVNLLNLVGSVEMDLERAFFGLNQTFLGLNNYLEDAPADEPAVRRIIDNLLLENRFLTGMMVVSPDGRILYWNSNYQKPNIKQRDYFKAFKDGYPGDFFIGAPQESILNKGQWIFGVSRAFRDSSGKLTRVISAIIDTNKLNHRYQNIFERTKATLSILSATGQVYVQIPGHQEHVGSSAPFLSNMQLRTTKKDTVQYYSAADGSKQLGIIHNFNQYPLFVSVLKSDDKVFAQWHAGLWVYYLLGGSISLALLLLTYLTARSLRQQQETTRQLQQQAISDPLTGLYNRRYIMEQTKLELKKAQRLKAPLSLIMLDLDEFKRVNDNCGHDIGDRVLIDTARQLKEKCRDTDLISRYGGEEFLLTLPGTDLSGALHIAEKIRQQLETHIFEGPQGDFRVTGSFGVCQFKEYEELDAGIKRADDALYQAKGKGRNQIVQAQHDVAAGEPENDLFWINKRL